MRTTAQNLIESSTFLLTSQAKTSTETPAYDVYASQFVATTISGQLNVPELVKIRTTRHAFCISVPEDLFCICGELMEGHTLTRCEKTPSRKRESVASTGRRGINSRTRHASSTPKWKMSAMLTNKGCRRQTGLAGRVGQGCSDAMPVLFIGRLLSNT
jgi:hypothetical protein